jgi:hypothetical protein
VIYVLHEYQLRHRDDFRLYEILSKSDPAYRVYDGRYNEDAAPMRSVDYRNGHVEVSISMPTKLGRLWCRWQYVLGDGLMSNTVE